MALKSRGLLFVFDLVEYGARILISLTAQNLLRITNTGFCFSSGSSTDKINEEQAKMCTKLQLNARNSLCYAGLSLVPVVQALRCSEAGTRSLASILVFEFSCLSKTTWSKWCTRIKALTAAAFSACADRSTVMAYPCIFGEFRSHEMIERIKKRCTLPYALSHTSTDPQI